MIKELVIQNNESHKDTRIKFSPSVNTITGESDMGKSVIIRAIRLIAENRPSGYEYRSWFSKKKDKSVSRLVLSDGEAERIRSSTENIYRVNGVKLEGFGQDVPEQVSDLLSLGQGALQLQLDSHYLLSDSPPEVARILNRIVRLDEIDTLSKNLGGKKNSTEKEIKIVKQDLIELVEQEKKFENLPDIEVLIADLEKISFDFVSASEDEEKLEYYVHGIEKKNESLEEINDFLSVEEDFNSIEEMFNKYDYNLAEIDGLEECVGNIERVKESFDKIVIPDEVLANDLLGKITTVKRLDSEIRDCDVLVKKINDFIILLNVSDETIQEAEESYGVKIKEVRESGMSCPVIEEYGSCLYPKERK